MTLVNRYLLKAFGRIFFLSLATFSGIYLLVDFFEKVDDLMEHRAAAHLYFLYFLPKIPAIVTQITPLAVLMAVFMTLGGFSRTNELTAMRSSGISLWRIAMPLLGVSLLIALAALASGEFLAPLGIKKANHIMRIDVEKKPELTLKRNRIWLREGNDIVNIHLAQPEKNILRGITTFRIDDHFRLRSRIDAPIATFEQNHWVLKNPTIRTFNPESGEITDITRPPFEDMVLSRTPVDFQASVPNNEEMGYRQLRAIAQKLQAEGYDPTRQRVDLNGRLANPFASVIMAFLGIPFALRKGRGTSLAVGITISVGIGIAYHIIQAILIAFGYSGALPPVLAAWSANLLFGLLGVWLLLTARQ